MAGAKFGWATVTGMKRSLLTPGIRAVCVATKSPASPSWKRTSVSGMYFGVQNMFSMDEPQMLMAVKRPRPMDNASVVPNVRQ